MIAVNRPARIQACQLDLALFMWRTTLDHARGLVGIEERANLSHQLPIVLFHKAMDAAAPSDDVTNLAFGDRLGPYEIERLVGRGGMGIVYRARDTRLD